MIYLNITNKDLVKAAQRSKINLLSWVAVYKIFTILNCKSWQDTIISYIYTNPHMQRKEKGDVQINKY